RAPQGPAPCRVSRAPRARRSHRRRGRGRDLPVGHGLITEARVGCDSQGARRLERERAETAKAPSAAAQRTRRTAPTFAARRASRPRAWLALYFLPRFATGDLREDGSPRDTGVIPPMPLPRRMFAGERVRLHRPLVIGESVRRETTLADLSVKSGGTGTLVFATVTSRVLGADGVMAVEDERRTV